jgi:heat shock protein HslJ
MGLMDQEREYVEALQRVTAYHISDKHLEMKNQIGEVILVFAMDQKLKTAPLLETHWVLKTLNGHAIMPDSTISAAFKEGEYLPVMPYIFGMAGCNDYSFQVEVDKDQIRFLIFPYDTSRISTDRACTQPGLLEQESEYLETLLTLLSAN